DRFVEVLLDVVRRAHDADERILAGKGQSKECTNSPLFVRDDTGGTRLRSAKIPEKERNCRLTRMGDSNPHRRQRRVSVRSRGTGGTGSGRDARYAVMLMMSSGVSFSTVRFISEIIGCEPARAPC